MSLFSSILVIFVNSINPIIYILFTFFKSKSFFINKYLYNKKLIVSQTEPLLKLPAPQNLDKLSRIFQAGNYFETILF